MYARFCVQSKRRELKEKAVRYKGGRCEICGYDKCPMAMVFHHVNPIEKDFAISASMTSWARIQGELDKCVLLCSNCHAEVHEGYHPGRGYLTDELAERPGDDWHARYDDENNIPLEWQ